MRLYVLLAGAAIIASLALTACNSRDGSSTRTGNGTASTTAPAAPTTSMPSDGVRRVTTAELHDALEKGTAVVIDVRSAESYKISHIKGALSIPEPEIAARKGELPPGKTIVLYCS
jgi:3-mercaptopyruvate sulfurtransferase SseA